jgi:hypothetical protein
VCGLRSYRFRALVTLAAPAPEVPASHYAGGPHGVMVHACPPGKPGCDRYFPAAVCRDDETPLRPGEHAVVTITLADDQAGGFFGPGQHFTVWAGGDVGHGVITRRVFTLSGP